MIVDFTISNFRSIKEKQTFSLFAEGSPKHLSTNIAYPNDTTLGVLRTSGVYGANASGKSNLLLAFEALRHVACVSGDLKDGDKISCYEPFLLSADTKNSPVSFEIEFITNEKQRFLYSISFNETKIIQESLDFYPTRQKANLFNRKENGSWKDVTFGANYKGGNKKFAFFKNNSYLSKAGNSADSPEIIRAVFNYLWRSIFHLGADQKVQVIDWRKDEKLIKDISSILEKVDTGISGLEFKETDTSKIQFPKSMPESMKKKILETEKMKPIFLHKGEDSILEKFTEEMESSGTIKLFNTLPMLLETFKDGGVLILDELDNSFHPHIAELIIQLFNDPILNRNNAQLIFSTHNINLMSHQLMRRDQIWFTQKFEGATTFESLDEFDKSMVKTDSPYSKWYEEGRFGAVPKIDVAGISSILASGMSHNAKT